MYEHFTLKRRIFYVFFISTILPIVCSALISYYAISSIMSNKIHASIESNLKQVQSQLENSINNLNHVSQQMSFQGSVGKKLDELLRETEPYRRSQLSDEIRNELRSITFTNPNIGLSLYYLKDDDAHLFENLGVTDSFEPDKSPLLFDYFNVNYYGPHHSKNHSNQGQIVLSALRESGIPARADVYIYIETGFKLAETILNNDRIGRSLSHILTDNEGKIVYSGLPDDFPLHAVMPTIHSDKTVGNLGYYGYKMTANQGWSVISVVPKAEFNWERDRWFRQISLFAVLYVMFNLMLGWLLWRMVYTPLRDFNKEIKGMSNPSLPSAAMARPGIPEFDYLLQQFQTMKAEIGELFREVERKERRRADMEIEKLLHQINPHFLMNTLNTAHWLAVMKNQPEIDRLVVSLNKLLYYNLGKTGRPGTTATVREEVEALEEYVTLQRIRYDFEFNVRIEAEENVLDLTVPRFILQPLVENALYHGLDDDGKIHVRVACDDGMLTILVQDTGAGMSEEMIRQLMDSSDTDADHRKVGMGIGMNYVKQMLHSFYDGKAEMQIDSEAGAGTTVTLRLPIGKKGAESES